jgi:nitronate monooxygenase
MHARLSSRFSSKFSLEMPIALAPMAYACGGALAGACSKAGALALVGGGYGELDWLQREYALALQLGDRERLGCGFITWRLQADASALDWVLDQRPHALMLSFGDPLPYAQRIAKAGVPLICQVQRMDDLPRVIAAGAQVVVVQGAEAGGHGRSDGRATFTFVPEAADWLAAHAPDVTLLAAGGIADGRGVAAALVLGADGVLMGSRLWATAECIAPPAAKEVAVRANGDASVRDHVFDIVRRKNWPREFDFRTLSNELQRRWSKRGDELRANVEPVIQEYEAALKAGDYSRAHVTVGEATGLIRDVPPAGELLARIWRETQAALG